MSTAKYRATHKERIKMQNQKYYADNREQLRKRRNRLPWAKYLEQRRGGIPSKKKLQSFYFDQRLSISEIASVFSVGRQTVQKWFTDCGIHRRTASEAKLNYHAKNPGVIAGPRHPSWKGGKVKRTDGYVFLWMPSHPKATSTGYVLEHRVIAEKAFGKPLPDKAIVHHANGDGYDNRRSNLVICENDAYHKLLHLRKKKLANLTTNSQTLV
jgi:hypothetical protein